LSVALPTRRELLVALTWPALPAAARASPEAAVTARLLAACYPIHAPLGYVGALAASAQRRLNGGRLPPGSRLALLALREAAPAVPPIDWPVRAGHAAFAEAALHDSDTASRELALQAVRTAIVDTAQGPRLAGLRNWTDDLFMAALLFDRALPLLPGAEQPRAAEALAATLLTHAERLQRGDGLFDHAEGSPVAWGRGNGFASLGLALALAGPPSTASRDGARLLPRLQMHLHALLPLQQQDGLWRQVLDDAASPVELTATAMNLTALAMARSRGWLPEDTADGAIARAWAAVSRRIDAEGGFSDVCASTPAGPTLAFYRNRPITSGRDDRAAALVLQAALAMGAAGQA